MLIQCIFFCCCCAVCVCFFFHSPLWERMTSRRLFISVITFYVLCVAERHCFVLVEFTFSVSIDLYLLHGLFTCSHTHKKTERSAQIMAKCSIVFTRYNIDIDGIFLYLVLLLLVLLVVVLLFFPILTIDTRFFFTEACTLCYVSGSLIRSSIKFHYFEFDVVDVTLTLNLFTVLFNQLNYEVPAIQIFNTIRLYHTE